MTECEASAASYCLRRVPSGIPGPSWQTHTREASKRAWSWEELIRCYFQVTQKDSRKKVNQRRASGQQESYKLKMCEQEMVPDGEIIPISTWTW